MMRVKKRDAAGSLVETMIALMVVVGTLDGFSTSTILSAEEKVELQRAFDTNREESITSLTFSADGKTLAGGTSHAVVLWNVADGSERERFSGARNTAHAVALSPHGLIVASGGLDQVVTLHDTATGREVGKFSASNAIMSLAFSADAKLLVAGDMSRVHLWDVATGELKAKFQGNSWILCAALSPDRKLVAYGSTAANFDVIDVAAGKPTPELNADTTAGRDKHTDAIQAVAFGPSGKILATASRDRTIKLWDVGSGIVAGTLTGHADEVNSISFSPDGKRLVSGSKDQTIRLWDVSSGRTVAVVHGQEDSVQSVAFGPGGRQLASAGPLGTLKLWKIRATPE